MNLNAAVQQLYEVFGVYPKPVHIDACPCCMTPDEVERLLRGQLRHLTPDDLRAYAASAMLTVGRFNDFRHFLPRMFEIAAADDFNYPDPQSVIGRLRYVKKDGHRLSVSEWAALQAFWLAWWNATLADPRGDAGTVLASILCAGEAPDAYLSAWRAHPAPAAAGHLAHFVKWHLTTLASGKSFDAYLDDRPVVAQVFAWLSEPATRGHLEQAFFADMTGPFAHESSLAVSYLEVLP